MADAPPYNTRAPIIPAHDHTDCCPRTAVRCNGASGPHMSRRRCGGGQGGPGPRLHPVPHRGGMRRSRRASQQAHICGHCGAVRACHSGVTRCGLGAREVVFPGTLCPCVCTLMDLAGTSSEACESYRRPHTLARDLTRWAATLKELPAAWGRVLTVGCVGCIAFWMGTSPTVAHPQESHIGTLVNVGGRGPT